MEGDFGDLYSNCNKNLLEECIITAGKISNLQNDSIDFILNLLKCSMNHSYFHEPTGIFKTLEGFPMGDNSAVKGSELMYYPPCIQFNVESRIIFWKIFKY